MFILEVCKKLNCYKNLASFEFVKNGELWSKRISLELWQCHKWVNCYHYEAKSHCSIVIFCDYTIKLFPKRMLNKKKKLYVSAWFTIILKAQTIYLASYMNHDYSFLLTNQLWISFSLTRFLMNGCSRRCLSLLAACFFGCKSYYIIVLFNRQLLMNYQNSDISF